MNNQTAFPLSWPSHRPRSKSRHSSPFGSHSVDAGTSALRSELRRLGTATFVLSSNVELRLDGFPRSDRRSPTDPGVAVYFDLNRKPIVFCCDKWDKVEDNIWAIVKHIEAIRGTARWGCGEMQQAFAGYTALPPPADLRPWFDVLGVAEDCTVEQAREAWVAALKGAHPDAGGDHARASAINGAYQKARELRS